jgi:Tfp pilus assembly protein PilF
MGNTAFRDDMLWRLSLAYWREGNLAGALSLLDEAVARRPNDLRIRLMRSGLLQQLGRTQDSHHEMREAVRLSGARSPEEAIRKMSEFVKSASNSKTAR